jgi:asparaginyl-tRNA synthetase
MVEAEAAFTDSLEEVVGDMEGLVRGTAAGLLDHCAAELELYAKAAGVAGGGPGLAETVAAAAWTTISYREAAELVADPRHGLGPLRGGDLAREHELWLCEHLGGPVAVVDWPAAIKPVYMREVAGSDGKLVSAVDVLVPGVGELCGGSLREHCPDRLAARLAWQGDRSLDWYLELRRQGAAPTGGFGLGFERLVQYLAGVEHIKDTVPFHRSPHSCPL